MLRSALRSPLLRQPTVARRLVSSTALKSPTADRAEFSELRERALLRHVFNTATEGNPESVMEAMDVFWDTYFNGEGTKEWKLRGAALDQAVRSRSPTSAMEIGAYCGYTAVRIGRLMPDDGKLVSVEIDPLFAAIATKVVEYAGLSSKVTVEVGSLTDRLPVIQRKGLGGPLGAILLDHETSCYLPDIQLLEAQKMVAQDTIILCDWSLYPGSEESAAPTDSTDFLAYLKTRGGEEGVHTVHSRGDKQVFTVSAWDFPAV